MLTTLPHAQAALDFLRARGASGLASDTRRLQAGDAFIAWPGLAVDPRRYVSAALAAGASACLVDAEGVEAYAFDDARIAALPGLKAATGEIAHRYTGEPSEQLDVIAVTGTNGKTSTAWWTAQALTALGRRCGLIGTLGEGLPFHADGSAAGVTPTGFTTPDPVTLHTALRRFADQGAQACALEASSIGIDEHRMAGLRVAVAQFTNFTQDHLDYHGSMAAYWQAKRALFDWHGLRAAVINIDDEYGASLAAELLADELRGAGLSVWTTSLHKPACLRATNLRYEADGMAFDLIEGEHRLALRTPLVGEFNVSNVLAVVGAVRALGASLEQAAAICARLVPVPGRMQCLGGAPGQPLAVVDYAHTPDALDKALRALRPLAQARGGKLWVVFGCGGNRDATKRPLMGGIAQQQADRVVLTSDNPRDEPPAFVLAQILAGVAGHDEVDVIEDRAEAIRQALHEAASQDVVLIAGKGHETTQEVAGVKTPFADAEHAQAALSRRLAA
ncbi:UDP-N-acetylmuramoyl-L-alanyl-D-glutamate--2,6-diaminopimelate ligase [Aquabacterium sp.]|uniref:UDP-N-acetylmuramoyl-L-alanyl-D-glutamate--2, 6-diaminopimelate ligase n=1 Tax=Aquabacterium sp. TaxID=1872578 RepID=UPI0035B3D96E